MTEENDWHDESVPNDDLTDELDPDIPDPEDEDDGDESEPGGDD